MPNYPAARREDVIKTVGGISYPDPYAWLHEDSEEALAWGAAQNRIAEDVAQGSPRYDAVRAEVLHWHESTIFMDAPRLCGDWWFRLDEGDAGQRMIAVIRAKQGGADRIIADTPLLARDRTGAEANRIMYFEPSPQGRYVALFFADGTIMNGEWRVVETETGRVLPVAQAAFSLSRPGWLPDQTGFWVPLRAENGDHFLHFVAVADNAPVFADIPLSNDLIASHISGLAVQVSPDGRQAVLTSEPHERIALVLVDLASGATRAFLPAGWPNECDGSWRDSETYVARITADASRGRVVAIPVATSQDAGSWRELVPEGEGAIRFAGLCVGRLVVCDLVDAAVRIRIFDADGSNPRTVPLEAMGSSPMAEIQRALRPTDALAIPHQTFHRSIATYVYDVDSGALAEFNPPKHRLEGIDVEQRFATSRDGTRIPYSVVRKHGFRQGPQPTLIYGYGGYNLAVVPGFLGAMIPFVEAGGVYVRATLRGGGEYGRDWYEQGKLENKHKVFEDLFAVAEDLIARGDATPDTLAMNGLSNGGLLAGAAIAHRPDLWRVVVPQVPLFDLMEGWPLTPDFAMIRAVAYEDYGDTSKPDEARMVFAWSPYQNLKDETAYPAVFSIFGEHDIGCLPFHGRKFTAALQHATTSDRPILCRLWKGVGHQPLDQETAASYYAEWLSFVMDQLGMPDVPLGAFRTRDAAGQDNIERGSLT